MDFLRKFHVVKISLKSVGTDKKSNLNNNNNKHHKKNKQSTMLKNLNGSDSTALSDYSDDDDEEDEKIRSHRQNALQKRAAAKKSTYVKREASKNTIYLNQNGTTKPTSENAVVRKDQNDSNNTFRDIKVEEKGEKKDTGINDSKSRPTLLNSSKLGKLPLFQEKCANSKVSRK